MIGWKDSSMKWPVNVLMGTLNPTHSLTHSLNLSFTGAVCDSDLFTFQWVILFVVYFSMSFSFTSAISWLTEGNRVYICNCLCIFVINCFFLCIILHLYCTLLKTNVCSIRCFMGWKYMLGILTETMCAVPYSSIIVVRILLSLDQYSIMYISLPWCHIAHKSVCCMEYCLVF